MIEQSEEDAGQTPSPSPLYHAQNSARYERQRFIADYEQKYDCRLIVVVDVILYPSVTLFEELLYDADPAQDLHLLLYSPGGDGEIAVRLVRAAQARCNELTIIVPDQAKSAATLLTLGADHILMSHASDLGPIDPQFFHGGQLVSAKDVIAAVDDAAQKVQQAPDTYPIYASLLSDVTALMVMQARSALDRTTDLLEEALKSNPNRSDQDVERLKKNLEGPLINEPKSHSALFSARDAAESGLPATVVDPDGEQWKLIWSLWVKYFALDEKRIYEGVRASQILSWPTGS